MSRKPDFFVVGAPRAGTSSLYYYLVQHPDVYMTYPKEPNFFYNRKSPGSPVLEEKRLDEYLRLFEGIPEHKQAGEASTSYLWSENAALEIKRFQPEAKIIIMLRDPVERAYSHYWHTMRYGGKFDTFEQALDNEPERIRQGMWHGFYYVDNGRYAGQVARYLDVFGRDSVKVYLFEDLFRDARGVCRDVFEFLGVDPDAPVETGKIYNRGGAPRNRLFARLIKSRIKRPIRKMLPEALRQNLIEWIKDANNDPIPEMDPKTRTRLKEIFREDTLHLEEMIGRDLSHWRD